MIEPSSRGARRRRPTSTWRVGSDAFARAETQLFHSDATDLHWAIVEFDPLRGRESIVTAGRFPAGNFVKS